MSDSPAIRFKVERTSVHSEDVPPCPEATEGTIERWDTRTFKSPEEYAAKRGESWFARGADHQVIEGPDGEPEGIKRRLREAKAWYVEIGSLADLMAFFERHGDLVLTHAWEDDQTPTIEIYDTWRE